MDILLSHGYFIAEDEHEKKIMKPYPTLGLLYISSYLKSKQFSVEIFDSTFSTIDEFEKYVISKKPQIIGLYCNLMTKPNILKMIQIGKQNNALLILGGPEPVNYKNEYLDSGSDFIVFGEGEFTLEDLIPILLGRKEKRLEDVDGIIYRNGSREIIQTKPREQIHDLSSLPWPDREAIDLQKYLDTWKKYHGKSSVSIITARGCPYTCTWCSHSVFGESHRRRTVEDVANEIEWIQKNYNPDQLWFADDVLTINTKWFLAFASELKKRGIKIPFECISRADRLNQEVVRSLSEIGCYRLWIGAESGSQRILDAMKRKADTIDVQEKSKQLQEVGIQVGMFIMLGYEGEKLSDISATISHLKKSNPDIFLTTVSYPIKGTSYFRLVENRVKLSGNWKSSNDRDYIIEGRPSKIFYEWANKWVVNEVGFYQGVRRKQPMVRLLRQFVAAKVYWLGSFFLSQSKEKLPAGLGWKTNERAESAW